MKSDTDLSPYQPSHMSHTSPPKRKTFIGNDYAE